MPVCGHAAKPHYGARKIRELWTVLLSLTAPDQASRLLPTRQMRSALRISRARAGLVRKALIESEPCYRARLLLTHRRDLKRKFVDLENAIRHSLKAFGIRQNCVGRGGLSIMASAPRPTAST